MKFGKYIQQNSTPEWKSQFLDYKRLKKIIKKIIDYKKEMERLRQQKQAQMQQQQLQQLQQQQQQRWSPIRGSESAEWLKQSIMNRVQQGGGSEAAAVLTHGGDDDDDDDDDDMEVILDGEPVDQLILEDRQLHRVGFQSAVDDDDDDDEDKQKKLRRSSSSSLASPLSAAQVHGEEMDMNAEQSTATEEKDDEEDEEGEVIVQQQPLRRIPRPSGVRHKRSGSIISRYPRLPTTPVPSSPSSSSAVASASSTEGESLSGRTPEGISKKNATIVNLPHLQLPPRPESRAERIPPQATRDEVPKEVTFDLSSPTMHQIDSSQQQQQQHRDLESGYLPPVDNGMSRSISREIIFRVEDIVVPTYYDEELNITLRYGVLAKEFLDRLNKELDKINRFFSEMERKCAEKQGALNFQINALRHEKAFLKRKKAEHVRHISNIKSKSEDSISGDMPYSVSMPALNMAPRLTDSTEQTPRQRRRRRSLDGSPPMRESFENSRAARQLAKTKRRANKLPAEVTLKIDEASRKMKAKQVKNAFQEHYRSLVLLENYRALNYVGFAKILKKFDKNSENNLSVVYMEKVSSSRFYTSTILQSLMQQTELNFTRYLYNNDRKKAMSDLRVPTKTTEKASAASFRSGTWLGMSIILSLVLIYIYFFEWNSDGTANEFSQLAMYLYRLTLFPMMLAILLAINANIWERLDINYVFIFEFDPRRYITKTQFSEVALLLFLSWTVSMFAYMCFSIFESRSGITETWRFGFLIPVIYTIILVLLLINPLKVMYRRTRFWLLGTLVRIFFAPFFEVKFKDFWLADQLTSLGDFLFQVQFVFCYSTIGLFPSMSGFCGLTTQIGLPLFNAWPFYARFMQCVRRFRDTKKFHPHISNAMKYLSSLVFIVFAFLDKAFFQSHEWNAMRVAWLGAGIVSTVYSLLWDYIKDWGLLQFGKDVKYPLLRSKLTCPWYWYYLAMVENLIIRFLWLIIFVMRSFLPEYMNNDAVLFITVFLNLFRRFVWNIFRLEMEHMYNIGEFRAVRDMPLPYDVNQDMDDMEADEGFNITEFKNGFLRCLYCIISPLTGTKGDDADPQHETLSTVELEDTGTADHATESGYDSLSPRGIRRMSMDKPLAPTLYTDQLRSILETAPPWLELKVADCLYDRQVRSHAHSATTSDRKTSSISRLLHKLSTFADGPTNDDDDDTHTDDTMSSISTDEGHHDHRDDVIVPPSPILTDFNRIRTLQENFVSNIRMEEEDAEGDIDNESDHSLAGEPIALRAAEEAASASSGSLTMTPYQFEENAEEKQKGGMSPTRPSDRSMGLPSPVEIEAVQFNDTDGTITTNDNISSNSNGSCSHASSGDDYCEHDSLVRSPSSPSRRRSRSSSISVFRH